MGKKIPEKELAAIAANYDVLKEFYDKEPSVYGIIRKRGLFDKLCGHMKRGDKKRSDEELAAIVENYDVLQEFREKEQAAYSLIVSRGLLKKMCGHMKRAYENFSDEELKERASKYYILKEFRENEKAAYASICARGLLKQLCGHMERANNSHTNEEIAEIARQYEYRKDFEANAPSVCSVARRRGIYDKVCEHMDRLTKPRGYWTKARCHQIAKRYKTRKEFERERKDAYAAAERNGWLNEICSHMKAVGNNFKRKIYVFLFTDKTAYVGLAQDPEGRYRQHLRDKRSPVYKQAKVNGIAFEYHLLTDWLHKDVAGKVEDFFINKYKEDGWTMLNRQRGGNLGGRTKKYNPEQLQEEADKYEYIDDFREGSPLAYGYIIANHMFEDYCAKMKPGKSSRLYWTLERAIAVVPECKNRRALIKKYPKAWELLRKAELLDKYYPLNNVNGPFKRWTVENSKALAATCSTRDELREKSQTAYKILKKEGLIDEYFPLRWRSYSDEEKLEMIQSCQSRKELQSKYPSAYIFARKQGLLDKYFPKVKVIAGKEIKVKTKKVKTTRGSKKKVTVYVLSEEEIQASVADCRNRMELSKKYKRVYDWAKKNNRLDELFPINNAHYTDEEKLAIIKGCKSRSELNRKHFKIWEWANKNGLLDKYFPNKWQRTTDEERIAIIKSCKNRHELNTKSLTTYNWAKERGLLDKYLPVYQKYTDEERMEIIRSCKSRSELREKSTSIYEWLRDNGKLDEYFPSLRKIYTDEERIAIMSNCKNRTELNEKYRFIYVWARKNNLLDKYFPPHSDSESLLVHQ